MANEGETGQEIADELGRSPSFVTLHKNIKEELHPLAWDLARGFTNNGILVNHDSEGVVNTEFANVNWAESHFRTLLKHLAYEDGDRPVMRAQIDVVRMALERFDKSDKKVTARWIGKEAKRLAWYTKLKVYARDNLADRVTRKDWLHNEKGPQLAPLPKP